MVGVGVGVEVGVIGVGVSFGLRFRVDRVGVGFVVEELIFNLRFLDVTRNKLKLQN